MHKMTGKRIAAFLLTAITVLLCAVGYQLFKSECLWWACAPTRGVTVYDLEVPSDLYPSGAEVVPLHPDRGIISAVEEAAGGAYWEDGQAVYILDRFTAIGQAAKWYQKMRTRLLYAPPRKQWAIRVTLLMTSA
jgi:hypothetical protein